MTTHAQGGATPPSPTLFLVDADSTVVPADRDAITSRLQAGRFFWLDIHGPDADGLALLRDVFGFHPIALEDSEHFGQRPKLDTYDDYVMLVVYGANRDEDDLVEVHCFLSEHYLVTVHHDDCPAFSDLRTRITSHHLHTDNAAFVLYAVVDALVDSFFPLLSEFDDRIDTIEDRVFQAPDDAQLQEVFAIKRTLVEPAQGDHPGARPLRARRHRRVRDPRHDARRGALLPRRLRPPDPHQRPHRQLPRPHDGRHGRLPVHRVQQAERRDEAADDRGHHLHAADLDHRASSA